jgi:hypothetical protein
MAEASRLRKIGTAWRKAKWLQYAGFKSDEYFYGIGQQKGKRHCILQASGPASQTLFDLVKQNEKFYCNRIDLQLTISEPKDYNPRKTYDAVRKLPGNIRNTSLILSDTGSTVYFGNRTSDTFARCYQKQLDEQKFLRFELEIKGVTARWVYENLRLGNLTPADAYQRLLERFKKPVQLENLFSNEETMNGEYVRFEHLKFSNDKLQWLMSLENSIIAMGNDHATGQQVKTWLENILNRIDAV